MQNSTQRAQASVTVDGITVPYFTQGKPSKRAPLVMVHGTAGSTDGHYGYLFPILATRQQVISIDLADPGTKSLSVDQLVAQVTAVIDAASPNAPVSLMGYSLGAVIAAATAAKLQSKIENLILVAGWMKTDTHQAMRNRVWQTMRDDNSTAITQFMTLCAFSPAFHKMHTLDEMISAAGMLELTDFVDKQMALNATIDISKQVSTISAATLVLGCTSDMMVHRNHSKALFGAINNARYAEIPSGHGVVHERPAEIFSYVDSFLKSPNNHPAGTRIPTPKP